MAIQNQERDHDAEDLADNNDAGHSGFPGGLRAPVKLLVGGDRRHLRAAACLLHVGKTQQGVDHGIGTGKAFPGNIMGTAVGDGGEKIGVPIVNAVVLLGAISFAGICPWS